MLGKELYERQDGTLNIEDSLGMKLFIFSLPSPV